MSKLDQVLKQLLQKRIIQKKELDLIAAPRSIPVYMNKLRQSGHKIKYVNGVYYYGGIRVKTYAEGLLIMEPLVPSILPSIVPLETIPHQD